MHDSPSNTATRSLEDYFSAMDYQTVPLEDLPHYQRYQAWQNTAPAPYFVADFVDDTDATQVIHHARQACAEWAALPVAERHYQLFELLRALQADSVLLSILESEVSEMPVRFGRDVYFPALWRDLQTVTLCDEGSSSIQLLSSQVDIALVLKHWWQGLARGCATIVVSERPSLSRIAQLWQARDLPQGLLAMVPVALLEPLRAEADSIPEMTLPQHDTAILSVHADSASSVHLLSQRVAALQRPLHLLVQEALLSTVQAQLEQACQSLQQGHPFDETSDGVAPVQVIAAEMPAAALPKLEAAMIALTSFRRLADVAKYLHNVPQLSFWSQNYWEVAQWQQAQDMARVSLNQLDITPVTEFIYLPASLHQAEAPAVAEVSEQQSLKSDAFVLRRPEAMQDIFYRQSADCSHEGIQRLLRDYASMQVQEQQARGDISLVIHSDMSVMSLAQLTLAILRMGNRLTIQAKNQAAALAFVQAVPALAVSLLPFDVQPHDTTVWVVGASVVGASDDDATLVFAGCPEHMTEEARACLLHAASLEHRLIYKA